MAYFEIDVVRESILIQINIPWFVFGERWILNTTVLLLYVRTKYSVDVIYNKQSITIEITICSTPDASVLYQYKTFDYATYISRELT